MSLHFSSFSGQGYICKHVCARRCRHFCFNIFNIVFASLNRRPSFHKDLMVINSLPVSSFFQPEINAPISSKNDTAFQNKLVNFPPIINPAVSFPLSSAQSAPVGVHILFIGLPDLTAGQIFPVIHSDLQSMNKICLTYCSRSTSSETQMESLTFTSSTGPDSSVYSGVM